MKLTSKRKQLGQGMMEYVIIVALIAVAAIGVYSQFGTTIRNQTAGLSKEISGEKADGALANAVKSGSEAQTRANEKKGMGTYNAKNDQK